MNKLSERPVKKKNIFKKILHKFVIPRLPMSAYKNVNPFGPAVWPARGNIYTNVLFHYIN